MQRCAYAIYHLAEEKQASKRKIDELDSIEIKLLSKTRRHYVREHRRMAMKDIIGTDAFFGQMNTDAFSRNNDVTMVTFFDSAVRIQALARGVLTRRKVHFALLSADPDALARIL